MLILIGVGLVAGLVTAVSPCVLPVLPILLAGGATGGTRRPFAIVAGLVLSFSAFTLGGVWLLGRLGLPKDTLRNVAIALLFLVAATLIFPRFGQIVERPLYRLGRRPAGDLGGGFLLGMSLGLVFVPCAGPVLAAITVLGATSEVSWRAVVLTAAYATGAAVPMLAIAAGGRAAAGMRALRPHALAVRRVLGVGVALTALAITFNVDRHVQTRVPDYVVAIQDRVERSGRAERELAKVRGGTRETSSELEDLGPAPEFAGVTRWINSKPLSLRRLRGKVVLIDFWTYSCINCLRTLPHLKAWDRRYRTGGLQIVGVHTPEFAFEHETDNVRGAVRRLGLRYPVAMDNDYATWNAYRNQYWPAKYLIDARGRLRYTHFGEGAYDTTESHIRALLAERRDRLPRRVQVADRTPDSVYTPETYLGYEHLNGVARDQEVSYNFPRGLLAPNELAYSGRIKVQRQRIVAGPRARVRLRFKAKDVFLVLSGRGRVQVLVDGGARGVVRVDGARLYTLLRRRQARDSLLELRLSRGLAAYAFTFG